MITEKMEQGSPEWFAARCGNVTGSRVADVVSKGRGSAPSASRKNYMAQLVAERLTGNVAETFTSPAMLHGIETEAEAANAYAFLKDAELSEIGFAWHDTIKQAGASPDRLVGADGLVEIKCPNTATHLDTLRGGSIKGGYVIQMQWQMSCTGRAWCDFVSYDPRLPESMRLHCTRVERDQKHIDELEAAVKAFLAELETTCADLVAKYG